MTIKDIIQLFAYFTAQHPILRTFSWGNLADYSRDNYITEYPAFHAVPQPSLIEKNYADFNFNILIYDLLNEYIDGDPINSNQLDSLSLTQQILNDFYAFFTNQLTQYGYFLNTSVNYTPFVDRFKEDVCGIEASITIRVEQTACLPDFVSTISVYSQVIDFSATPVYNSIIYRCDGTQVQACYSPGGYDNITDLVDLFNSNPGTDPSCPDPTYCYCWTDYGTYYDNGDGRIRCVMPTSTYNTLCSGGILTLDIIRD